MSIKGIERRIRDIVTIHFEETAQFFAGVGPAEAIRAKYDVIFLWQKTTNLVREDPDLI